MAIKGKKKAQKRNKGTRRPAAAPRVQYSHQEHVPWHQTSGGRVGIAIGIVLLIAAIAAIIITVTSEPEADVAAQDELSAYSEQLKVILDTASGPGADIAAAPGATDADGFETLKEDAAGWGTGFESAQLTAVQQPAPPAATRAARLIQGSLQLYAEAARTYELAAEADGKLATKLLERAAAQRDLATSLWVDAVGVLDDARLEVGLAASGTRSPVEGIPGSEMDPTPAPTDS